MIADRRRRVEVEPVGPARLAAAEHLDEVVVDDLDDHLARRDRAQHLLPDRLLAHPADEIAHDRQRDIGFEQRDADLAQRRADIVLGQRAAPAQPVEDVAEAVAQAVEHGRRSSGGQCRSGRRATLADRPAPIWGLAMPCAIGGATGRYRPLRPLSTARPRGAAAASYPRAT